MPIDYSSDRDHELQHRGSCMAGNVLLAESQGKVFFFKMGPTPGSVLSQDEVVALLPSNSMEED